MAGSGLVVTANSASATASAFTCKVVFDDGNTAGIKCTGSAFTAFALCKNNKYAIGATAASGTTSYAYCTSYNSSLASPRSYGGTPV